MSTPADTALWAEGPVRAILSGQRDAQAAVDAVIDRARKSLRLFDLHLRDRGYNSPARIERLRNFLLGDRARFIHIALHESESMVLDCPRLVTLAQQFPTSVRVHRTLGQAREAMDPLVIADEAHFWHHLHHQHPRSVLYLEDAAATAPLLERFEQIWELTEPRSPGSAVGL